MPFRYLLFVWLLATAASLPAATTVQVFPIGDSITEGYIDGGDWFVSGGYRSQLANDLAAAGYVFAYTGIFTSNPSDNLTTSGNIRHCGCTSWRIDDLNASLVGAPAASVGSKGSTWARSDSGNWLQRMATAGNSPDIILFMAGTNDLSNGAAPAILRTRIETTLNTFLVNRPDGWVFIGNVIARKESLASPMNVATQDFNSALARTIIPAWKTAHPTHKVVLVDQYAHFAKNPDHLHDLLHPNQTGYNAMGTIWANAIKANVPVARDSAGAQEPQRQSR